MDPKTVIDNQMNEAHSFGDENKNTPIQYEKQSEVVLHHPAQASPMAMLQMLVERGADLSQVEKMMDLADRHQKKEAENAFTKAMAAFKANAPDITKDRLVVIKHKDGTGETRYHHASLAEVSGKIATGLGKYGLSHHWEVDQSEAALIKVTCFITHELGHFKSVSMKSNLDTTGQKNGLQQIASTVTYLERYTLTACAGVAASDHDDDGRTSETPPQQNNNNLSEGPEPYPQERFNANFEEWKSSIESGAKTRNGLIAFIKAKGAITEEQLEAINDIQVKNPQ